MRWLAECSAGAIGAALRVVAPELAGYPVMLSGQVGGQTPTFHGASAPLGEDFFVKFAWSRPAALRLAHQIGILRALAAGPVAAFLPEVVAASTDPLLLVTRRAVGQPLFAVAATIDRDDAGRQLAAFLAALQQPAVREHTEATAGPLPDLVLPPATPRVLREQAVRWLRPDQRPAARRWCDWAEAVLAAPAPSVLVHGDFHGDNQIWNDGQLRTVLDFENAAAGDPEYDLRTLPGPGLGSGVELLTATVDHYRRITGRQLSMERIMAWHLRSVLNDIRWRTDAGLLMTDGRTPPDWADDLTTRFAALSIDPTI